MYSASLGSYSGLSNSQCVVLSSAEFVANRVQPGRINRPCPFSSAFLEPEQDLTLDLVWPCWYSSSYHALRYSEELYKPTAVDISIWPMLSFFQVCLPGYKGWISRYIPTWWQYIISPYYISSRRAFPCPVVFNHYVCLIPAQSVVHRMIYILKVTWLWKSKPFRVGSLS